MSKKRHRNRTRKLSHHTPPLQLCNRCNQRAPKLLYEKVTRKWLCPPCSKEVETTLKEAPLTSTLGAHYTRSSYSECFCCGVWNRKLYFNSLMGEFICKTCQTLISPTREWTQRTPPDSSPIKKTAPRAQKEAV